MNQNGQSAFHNPAATEDSSTFNFYHNGVLENYTDPVLALLGRPEGSLLPGASDYRLTSIADESYEATPGMNMGGNLPALVSHEGHPDATNDPRTHIGQQAPTYSVQNTSLVERATAFFAASPVAALFLGLGGIVAFNHFALRNRGVGRGASRAGAGVAGVGAAAAGGATDTGKATIDAVNSAVGGAVEAVEGVTG